MWETIFPIIIIIGVVFGLPLLFALIVWLREKLNDRRRSKPYYERRQPRYISSLSSAVWIASFPLCSAIAALLVAKDSNFFESFLSFLELILISLSCGAIMAFFVLGLSHFLFHADDRFPLSFTIIISIIATIFAIIFVGNFK